MWLAHHFPGLALKPEQINKMLPEETTALRKAGESVLHDAEEVKLVHTKGIMRASSGVRIR